MKNVLEREIVRPSPFTSRLTLLVATTVVLLAVASVAGWRVFSAQLAAPVATPATRSTAAATAPPKAAPAGYQQVLGSDWQVLAVAVTAPTCRTPQINGGFANATQAMPTDLADCKANLAAIQQLSQKLLIDVGSSTAPAGLDEQAAALRDNVGALNAAAGRGLADLDASQPPAFWDEVNTMNAVFVTARFAEKLLVRG